MTRVRRVETYSLEQLEAFNKANLITTCIDCKKEITKDLSTRKYENLEKLTLYYEKRNIAIKILELYNKSFKDGESFSVDIEFYRCKNCQENIDLIKEIM